MLKANFRTTERDLSKEERKEFTRRITFDEFMDLTKSGGGRVLMYDPKNPDQNAVLTIGKPTVLPDPAEPKD